MKKKIVSLVLVFALALALGIGGTVAWLTAQSDIVTNTFVVGDINLSLAETTEKNFKIVPGGTDTKDPTLTVKEGSEECFVYVCVENNVKKDDEIVATPNIVEADWSAIGTSGNKTLYRYKATVNALEKEVELPVFTQVSYDSRIEKADIEALKDKTIVIQGYAHQSANTTQDVADAAAKAFFVIG